MVEQERCTHGKFCYIAQASRKRTVTTGLPLPKEWIFCARNSRHMISYAGSVMKCNTRKGNTSHTSSNVFSRLPTPKSRRETMPYDITQLRHLRLTIGQNIRTRRTQKRMTLRKLSRLSGISEPLLDHYELGKNEIGVNELFKIACALGVPVEKMMVLQ